jgi:hypothetical protein
MKTQQGKDTIPSTGQKERRYTPKRRETIQQEVNKLLKAGFIRSVNYPSWLADLVLLEKSNGSWRMCIDHTSLCIIKEAARPHGVR